MVSNIQINLNARGIYGSLPDVKLSTAAFVAELIRKCFAETVFPNNIRSQTISLGVTQAREDDDINSLCTRVDSALYKAKKNGKNQVVKE